MAAFEVQFIWLFTPQEQGSTGLNVFMRLVFERCRVARTMIQQPTLTQSLESYGRLKAVLQVCLPEPLRKWLRRTCAGRGAASGAGTEL